MLHLGRVMEAKRKQAKLSREALSVGICSKEYIYLVEKGKRSPSIEITKALGNRLNVDFESYLNYLDAEDPILVKDVIEDFVRFRQGYDFRALAEKTKFAEQQKDFKQAPYKYEVIFNKIVINHLKNRDLDRTQELIEEALSALGGSMNLESNEKDCCSEIQMRYYSLLASVYGYENQLKQEGELLKRLYKQISKKANQQSFHILYMSILMSYANYLYKVSDLPNALRVVEEIVFFQKRKSYLEKLHMTYYLLHLIQKKMGNDSSKAYDQALHLAKGLDREKDFSLLKKQIYY